MRRAIAFAALGLVTGTAVWLGVQLTRPEVLPLGAELPAIPVAGPRLDTVLREAGGERLVVLYFHTDCAACLEQLRMLEAGAPSLGPVRLYLLTDEENVDLASFARRWPRLSTSDQVSWGVAGREEFRRRFGARSTPAIFVFGPEGRLEAKLLGQRTVAAILKAAGVAAGQPAVSRAGAQEARFPAPGGQTGPFGAGRPE
jgi:hypothetical protein